MKRKKVILFLIVIVLITTQFVIASDISDSNVDPSIYDNRPRKSTSLVDNLPLPPEELEKSPCYGCIFDETCISFGTRLIYNEEQSYCSSQGKIKTQLIINSECMNNYECISNNCVEINV